MTKNYDQLSKEFRMLSYSEQLLLAGRDGEGTGLPPKLLTWVREAEAATAATKRAFDTLRAENLERAGWSGQQVGLLNLKSNPDLRSLKRREEAARLEYEALRAWVDKESRGIYTGFDYC